MFKLFIMKLPKKFHSLLLVSPSSYDYLHVFTAACQHFLLSLFLYRRHLNKRNGKTELVSTIVCLAHEHERSGLFGCKEVGGSKEIGKYNCSLSYLSKHRKRKIRKPLFLFSFTQSFPHFQSATVNFVVM